MQAILLLNASYEPLNVLPLRRAIGLWLRGRVEGVTDEAFVVRSASSRVRLPTVIRLKRYVNVPQRQANWSRLGVLRRDAYRCIYCGICVGERQQGRTLNQRDFTLDHLLPRSRGGRNSWSNTACACPRCNQRKADRTPHEAGMPLLWEPRRPRVSYCVLEGEIPEGWKLYLGG